MAQYIVKRLLAMIPVLIGVSLVVFFAIRVVPGDTATIILGEGASQEDVDALRHDLGMDRPLVIQYLDWLGNAARGDFGTSVRTGIPVLEEIGRRMTIMRSVDDWAVAMQAVYVELYRITRPGGWVAFEVGEVRRGAVRLVEVVAPLGTAAGFECQAVLINAQQFTKTANIWGISNNRLGTNTNRIVIFRKPERQ